MYVSYKECISVPCCNLVGMESCHTSSHRVSSLKKRSLSACPFNEP